LSVREEHVVVGDTVAFAAGSEAAGGLALAIGLEVVEGFTPTAAEIARLEAGLVAYLGRVAPPPAAWDRRAPLARRRGDYFLQVIGAVDGGRCVVVGQAFYKEWYRPELGTMDWREQPFFACDGGYDVWRVRWDVVSEAFVGFAVNGEA
jgi:hypothetical protein